MLTQSEFTSLCMAQYIYIFRQIMQSSVVFQILVTLDDDGIV
jgi:hypothetical protein